MKKNKTTIVDNPPTVEPTPEIDDSEKKNKNIFYVGSIFCALFLIVTSTTYFAYQKLITEPSITKSASPTPQPKTEIAITPTPTSEISNSVISVIVLNATSKSGLASTNAQKISNLGFKVVKTGNANKQRNSTIYVKPNLGDKTRNIITEIKSRIPNLTETNTSQSSEDIEIILGE